MQWQGGISKQVGLHAPHLMILCAGDHLTNFKTPAIGYRCQGREVYKFRPNGNLLQTQCSLVTKREKDPAVFRPSGFTVENHEQVWKKEFFSLN